MTEVVESLPKAFTSKDCTMGCTLDLEIGDKISFSQSSKYLVFYKNGHIFVREEDIFWVYN